MASSKLPALGNCDRAEWPVEPHFRLLPFFSVVTPSSGTHPLEALGSSNHPTPTPQVRSAWPWRAAGPDVMEGSGANWSGAVSLATPWSPRDVAREQGFPNYHARPWDCLPQSLH